MKILKSDYNNIFNNTSYKCKNVFNNNKLLKKTFITNKKYIIMNQKIYYIYKHQNC